MQIRFQTADIVQGVPEIPDGF